jgi:hypothetical protein
MSGPKLVVYTDRGAIEIPLTGDAKNDALLERFATFGGKTVWKDGVLVVPEPDPDVVMREALREGA